MPAKVEIYGTSNCKKCVNVRELLDRRNVVYIDYLIDLMPLEKDEMIRRTGLKYYPQIFINDKHIGGEEELLTLEADGELDELLGLGGKD
ncbi:MAG: glutaredoxin [Chromatiales bacterium]|nr:glutaredoxin [Chromatiales bacterium]